MATKSLGDLYVSLSLRSSEFSKGLAEAADKVEGLASKASAALGDMAEGFGVIGGIAAGALALAATGADGLAGVNSRAKAETERLQRATTLLAVEVSEVLLPAVRSMTDGVLRLVGMWRSLDEGTRQNIGSMLGWAAAIGLGLAGISRGLIVFKSFFELTVVLAPALGVLGRSMAAFGLATTRALPSVSSLGSSLSTFLATAPAAMVRLAASTALAALPFVALGAAIAGVALLVGAVYAAWRDTSTGLQAGVQALVERFYAATSAIEEAFSAAFRGVVSTVRASAKLLLEAVLAVARKVGSVMAPLARGAGQDTIASAWESAQLATADGVLEAFDRGAAALEQGARKAARALPGALAEAALGPVGKLIDVDMIGSDLRKALGGAKDILGDAYKALGIEDVLSRLERFGKGKAPGAPAAFAKVEVGSVGGGMDLGKNIIARASGVDPVRAARSKMLADQAKEIERAAKELADSVRRAADAARVQLVNRALGSLGDLGSMISNAMQAAAGGPLAVVASLALDLASRSEGFKSLMEVVTGVLQTVANALSSLFAALRPVVGALGVIITAVVASLQPVLNVVSNVLQALAPPLMVVGNLLQALAPVIAILSQVILMVTQPLTMLAGPILKALFDVLRYVSIVILTIVKAVGSVWNTILDAIIWVLKAIDQVPFVDLGDTIKAVAGMKLDTKKIGQQIDDLKDMGWDDALGEAGDAADGFSRAVTKAGQEMLNVPAIWKRALRAGQVQDGQLPPGMGSGTPATPTPSAPPPGTGTTFNIIGYDIDEATEHAMRMQEQERRRLSERDGGNPNAGARLVAP